MCEYFRRFYACMFVGIFVLYNFAQITKFNISKYMYVYNMSTFVCIVFILLLVDVYKDRLGNT